MGFTFESQGTNTFLVYEISADEELDTMSLGMLTNNEIPGLATATFTQMDARKFIMYNVSSKVSVAQLFSGPVNKKRLIGVFMGIISAMMSAEEYMLDPGSLALDLNYIFADVTTCETVVVCIPVMSPSLGNVDIGTFFKNIIFSTQFDRTENCDHVAQIINYLNSTPAFSLEDFKDLLERISRNAEANAAAVRAYISETAKPENVKPAASVQPTVTRREPAVSQQPQVRNETTVIQNNHPQTVAQTVQPETRATAQSVAAAQNIPAAPQVEEPMSLMYLLQHYSSENAAIYKAQQEAKKAKKAGKPAPQAAVPAQKQVCSPGFAIPGQSEPAKTDFAVPNQPTKVEAAQPASRQAAVPKPQPEPAARVVSQPAPQPAAQTIPQAASHVVQAAPAGRPMNFGETTVLGGPIGETTVLGVGAEPNRRDPHLIRAKNNEKIPLNKPVFRIGKERSYVDYFISDNTAISRGHANIVDHNGEFYVVDTNSTNHTYVNGIMIQPGVETKLMHGDKIRLANEDFEFRMF